MAKRTRTADPVEAHETRYDAQDGAAAAKPMEEGEDVVNPTFEQRFAAYLNQVAAMVVSRRSQPGGTRFGAEATFVLLNEAAEGTLRQGTKGFLAVAAYGIIGAMQSGGHWDDATPPAQQEEK